MLNRNVGVFPRYALAVMTAGLACLLTQFIPYLRESPSTLFIAAVMISAWCGGLGPGLVATVLAGLMIDYFFVLPSYLPGKEFADLVRWTGFMAVAFLISSLNAKGKQIEEILRRAQQEAETVVQVRTAELALATEALQAENADRKRAEEQLRQAQKMEAVGQLAGGVAHDFNNLLMVINGNCELALADLAPNDPNRDLIEEIRQSGEKAALLTRQLVAFGRKQLLAPIVLDLNDLATNMDKMLRRLIGEDIELVTDLDDGIGPVKADPGQIEQILLNLAVNARDAMPAGGRLTLQTRSVEFVDPSRQLDPAAAPGRYVMLAVTDTGCGMDRETQAHIFEPFFTTKEVGKGTGLGLATVYGIVHQSSGYIVTESEVGHGTTFRIYLPAVREVARSVSSACIDEAQTRGDEVVLVVEDEEEVRALLYQCLKNLGYKVLTASSGADALQLSERHPGPISLLVTDVVMPRIGGRELADRLVADRPELRVLFVSGYTEDTVSRHGVFQSEMAYLQKPFTLTGFAQKVREVLDQPACVA
jgi:signal transduction histidine kinase